LCHSILKKAETSKEVIAAFHRTIGRSPAHCIEYVHLILWGELRPSEEFDTDNDEHMKWVYNKAAERAAHFGIQVQFAVGTLTNNAPLLCTTFSLESRDGELAHFKSIHT